MIVGDAVYIQEAQAAASVTANDGGGVAFDIIHLPPKTREKREYKPKPKKLGLAVQYDALLEQGIIEIEEWLALQMIHNVDPLRKKQE